jgi:hypothetical protein
VEAVAPRCALPPAVHRRFEDGGNTIVGRWEKAKDGANYETDFGLIYRRIQ